MLINAGARLNAGSKQTPAQAKSEINTGGVKFRKYGIIVHFRSNGLLAMGPCLVNNGGEKDILAEAKIKKILCAS